MSQGFLPSPISLLRFRFRFCSQTVHIQSDSLLLIICNHQRGIKSPTVYCNIALLSYATTKGALVYTPHNGYVYCTKGILRNLNANSLRLGDGIQFLKMLLYKTNLQPSEHLSPSIWQYMHILIEFVRCDSPTTTFKHVRGLMVLSNTIMFI